MYLTREIPSKTKRTCIKIRENESAKTLGEKESEFLLRHGA
jgi:hypothetical protein